jgi:hypothetical protein
VAHAFHQGMMSDVVEAGLNVAFDYPLVRRIVSVAICRRLTPRLDGHTDMFETGLTAASGPEPV